MKIKARTQAGDAVFTTKEDALKKVRKAKAKIKRTIKTFTVVTNDREINTSQMRSVTMATRGNFVRLSRTGKGSVSDCRTHFQPEQVQLMDEAYAFVRSCYK